MTRLLSLLLVFLLPVMVRADVTIFVRRAAVTGTAATSYTSAIIAGWNLDEASGTRDSGWGSCGADCDLTDNNTVVAGASYMEGTGSADMTRANDESLSCAAATCDELYVDATNITFGCWANRDSGDNPSSNADVMFTRKVWSGQYDGYNLSFYRYTYKTACGILDGTDIVFAYSADNSAPYDAWKHAVCTFDNTGNSIQAYINGAASGSAATQEDIDNTGNDQPWNIGTSGANDWGGMIDECFVDDAAWAATNVCFACSCGLTGNLCMCDASTPANYKSCTVDGDCQVSGNTTALCNGGTCVGRNNTETVNCGSCTLPDCNHSAP